MPSTRLLAAAIAAFALLPATAQADVTLTARPAAFEAAGVANAHAGYTRVTVRNTTDEPHGVLLVRLRRELSTARALKLLETNDEARVRPLLALYGGIQSVAPGKRWVMTERLDAGTYLAFDYGSGPAPRVRRFTVAPGHAGAAPRPDGRITMTDDALTATRIDGHGLIEIPNRGSGWHELSLVRTPPGTTAQDVLDVIHSGEAPPPSFVPHEALWVLDPGRTAFVRFDLPKGHYVALCLIEGHAEGGMSTVFDVS